MKQAFAGGYEDPYQQYVQQAAYPMMEQMEPASIWESLVYEIGDHFGYGWIVGLAALGAFVLFRKRIKEFLRACLKD